MKVVLVKLNLAYLMPDQPDLTDQEINDGLRAELCGNLAEAVTIKSTELGLLDFHFNATQHK